MFKPLERHIAQELAVQQVFCMHLIVQIPLCWFPFPYHCFQLDLLTSGMHGSSGKRQELGISFSSFKSYLCFYEIGHSLITNYLCVVMYVLQI